MYFPASPASSITTLEIHLIRPSIEPRRGKSERRTVAVIIHWPIRTGLRRGWNEERHKRIRGWVKGKERERDASTRKKEISWVISKRARTEPCVNGGPDPYARSLGLRTRMYDTTIHANANQSTLNVFIYAGRASAARFVPLSARFVFRRGPMRRGGRKAKDEVSQSRSLVAGNWSCDSANWLLLL